MELGISMFGDLGADLATGKFQPTQQRLAEIIEEIRLMDEVGLDYFGIGEHHRPDYAVPSPEIVLAAAATVTKRIKLGSAVSVISSSDPVKLYQNFAMIDLLSGGRAELMAGRGSFIESFPLFGYNLQDYDALFAEKLDLLLTINKNERVTWRGKFRAPLDDQAVLPRAVNDELPIWIAVGGTPQSVVRAGKLGLPLMIAIIGGTPAQFQPLFELYKTTYLEHGHDPARFQVGIHSHALFGDHASELSNTYFPKYAAQMDRVGRSRGWPPYQRTQFDFGMSKHGALFVGEADAMADKILHYQELFGLTRFAAHMDVGAPAHRDIMKSIEIFGTKIAPQIKKALAK
ncbi:LLM class flavin-dependent oxidoreductase [Parapedobacter sp. ISTM3]|uniref:Probable oxidoreductase, LLM family n=1 Tax=Parapedobacter luteus TaxID=623280 RepID=A0A1T5AFQ3_9SPHI|nr:MULTISPECIES: LLM class flavin-dependent oxidoreductase [Parapedobacter]MBK1441866.1 LLM class flavin-dependent oxidoreductase [Parapedobacter sp. ISTM3]SKB33740.1 probable oxidoreductase, LLM family [Parapedobacter luteus]